MKKIINSQLIELFIACCHITWPRVRGPIYKFSALTLKNEEIRIFYFLAFQMKYMKFLPNVFYYPRASISNMLIPYKYFRIRMPIYVYISQGKYLEYYRHLNT